MMDAFDLRPDQHFMASLVRNEAAKMIVAPMGRGKSAATLTGLRYLLDSFTILRVLIVAPLLVAKETWPGEIDGWEHTRLLRYAVAVGTEAERIAAVALDREITIINRENLVWLAKHLGSVDKWPYDCVVVDENLGKAGRKRTVKAKVRNAAGRTVVRKGGRVTRFGVLAAARRKISRIYLLTGTPGQLHDLWGSTYLLDQGARLGATRTAFEKRWFDSNKYTHQVTARDYAEAEITARVQDVMVSLPPLRLVPDPVFVNLPVKLPPKIMERYREFERTLYSQRYDVEAVSRGVLVNKLLQWANGSMYREDRSIAAVHTEKLDALTELLERADGDPMLIFYGFKFDLAAIRERHPDVVVLRESPTAVRDWNAGKITKLLAHPASCAHGLNMQFGGHLACWYGLTWNLELYLQANARLPRPGQRDLVAIYRILAEGTMDDDQLLALDRKGTSQDRVTNAVLARLDAYAKT